MAEVEQDFLGSVPYLFMFSMQERELLAKNKKNGKPDLIPPLEEVS